MEALPRLPMLSFELRTSVDKVDFGSKLKQYIRSHYNEDPTLYASGITAIESMRREAVCPSKNVNGCSLLKRYYCQLHFMASRFPMHDNEETAVSFSWKSLHSNSTVTLNDISLEMASVLYNIGALHTQLGAMDNRTTADGMKMSCTHFQCAAWAFQHIIEEFPYTKKLGFSQVLLCFLAHLCLAQAQECILEKSMMDNRKSAITAKVAVQVVDYYRQSLKLLLDWPLDENNSSEISNSKVFKKWDRYIQFKVAFYESISLLFQGQQSEDQQKMGERVAFYQAAFEKWEETSKLPLPSDLTENIDEALTFVHDVIAVKKKAAKNENEFIYHEDVPNTAHLPKIKGASLVKGIPFSINDPEVCGPDLFSSIIPMKAHEYSSLYSEEKAKLLRRINEQIENKDEELETFLSMLDLEEFRLNLDGNKLPMELIDKCASLNAKPDAIQNLKDAMATLSNVYHDVEAMLNEIKELLKDEENHEKEYQQMVGKRPPSIAATDLTREAKKYQEAHAKASESNQTLHRAMVMHISNLKLLSLPLKELINHIPSIGESPEIEAITNEMRHLISKVDEMKQQRLMLAGQLRDAVCQDDITSKVITYSGDKITELFEEELKKYDKCVSLIEQNLAAQENILRAMKDAYARYGSTRKSTGESHRKRTAMISSLIASYDAYEDLVSKANKGLDFYKKLETNVSKLLQRVKGTCKVQDEEREQLLRNVKKPDFAYPSETPVTSTLKLKDYLNIKKETGKLSIDHTNNVPPMSPYYNDSKLPQQSWIPGIRPAPVGSEETDTNLKGTPDTFRGFYQGQGKDQVWSNDFYSPSQNEEQKLKYYLSQNIPLYQAYSQNPPQTQGPDLYPISSYSTVMPKTEGQGYEPKSNYYDIQSSPNRTYTSAQLFKEPLSNCPGNTIPAYETSEVGYTQPLAANIYNQAPPTPQYGYSSQIVDNYGNPQASTPQPTLPAYLSINETSVGAYDMTSQNQTVAQSQVSSMYNADTFPQTVPYGSTDSSQISYMPISSGYCSFSDAPPADYNSYAPAQPAVYSSKRDPISGTGTSVYPINYQTPATETSLPTSNFSVSQPQIQPYQSTQNYHLPMTEASTPSQIPTYMTPVQPPPTDGATVNPYYLPHTSEPVSSSSMQNPNVPNSWEAAYNRTLSNQQYYQSGNQSLYTAPQITNNYAMTNSEVYKAAEVQNMNYPANPNPVSQFYTNQYGAYGGQTDFSSQKGNPATYMQAGTEKQQAVTTTTFSNSEAKSSPVTSPSNVDLLAGLDFNINHLPLEPQTTVTAKKEGATADVASKSKNLVNNVSHPESKVNLTKESNEDKGPPKDWMTNTECLGHFAQEVEKYEKFVEGLTLKTLNGPTTLDLKWKEISDHQEKISSQHIISVARCYPMKNRFPDILPYDDSRIELPSTKDDYINASKIMNLTKLTPPFILTQAPLPSTYSDFWAMVFEQQVEIIICLLKDSELDGHIYWPCEKGQELEMGKLKISLQSSNLRSHWIERILSLCVAETKMTRVVIHLQFIAWPGSLFPESPGPFLSFTTDCLNFFNQQRSYSHPVVVHCTSGVGRTGLFCLLIASLLDVQTGKGIPDLAALAARMCEFRKSCLRDREHLKFAYQAVLYYCQDFLMKRGILTSRYTFEDKKSKSGKCHIRHPSEDFLVGSGSESDKLQASLERLEIDSHEKNDEAESKSTAVEARSQSVCSLVSHTSSGRSSPSLPADNTSNLDSTNFSLKADQNQNRKRFTSEGFNKNSALRPPAGSNDDPLSQLDPLWTMKK